MKLEPNGHLLVYTSQVPQGQSHETTLAQIAAEEMGVPFDHVTVLHGDTRSTPFKLIGTGGSMSATWASGAVRVSTRKVKEKVLAIASALLEISADDLEIEDGSIIPAGCLVQGHSACRDRDAGDDESRHPPRRHRPRARGPGEVHR